jgi:hypothetical protein
MHFSVGDLYQATIGQLVNKCVKLFVSQLVLKQSVNGSWQRLHRSRLPSLPLNTKRVMAASD